MICAQCGTDNPSEARFCLRCGRRLAGATLPDPGARPADDPVVSKVIPYRNVPALVAYYCGVFGLIPCAGLLLGPAALVLGILGLGRARSQPEVGGRVHAWVGLVLGVLEIVAHGAFGAWMVLAAQG